jgi:hypothetical protein
MGLMGTVAAIKQVKAIKLPSTTSIRLPARPPCFPPSDATPTSKTPDARAECGRCPHFLTLDRRLRARGRAGGVGRRRGHACGLLGTQTGMRTNRCGGGVTTVLTADAMGLPSTSPRSSRPPEGHGATFLDRVSSRYLAHVETICVWSAS